MLTQQQVLNKILSTKDFSIITLNNLTEDYFFNYKNEFNFIKNHINATGGVPDKATFLGTFPNFEIFEVTEPDSYLLDQLTQDHNAAYLAMCFNTIKSKIESGDTQGATEFFKKAIDGFKAAGSVNCVDLISNFDRYDTYLDMQAHRKDYFISTGLQELDDRIYGIDIKNENMVIAARTGIGKSWMLLIIAKAASLAGLTVGIYSGEMSIEKVGYRLDTLLSGISNKALTHGDMEVQRSYKHFLDGLKDRQIGAVKVLTPNMISGPATVDALEAFVDKEHIQILLIDQYSLLEDTSRTTIMHEKVANISKAIKNLQVKKQIPIISVAQMNRTKNEDKSQDTTQIGLSDRIGQDATCIIMLDRKQVLDKANPSARPQDQLVINVVKSRDGGSGKLTYAADFDSGEFTFIPENLNANDAQAMAASYEGEPVM